MDELNNKTNIVMKKIYLLLAVALIGAGCYAQKSNVKQAKSISGQYENPDFKKAHELIGAALLDPTTKDLTETWYVAGLLGYNEMVYDYNLVQYGGGSFDEKRLFEVVNGSYDYWLKADSLSQIPNEKGKVDQKTRKQIADKMVEYYQKYILANYALELNSQNDFVGAYEMMGKHYSIPELDMMQDAKYQEKFVKDTTYYIYYYYMGRFAYQAKMYKEAIDIFEKMQSEEVRKVARESDVKFSLEYKALCEIESKDTVAYISTMKTGIERYPSEEWFTANLVNHYIFSNKYAEAIEYLERLIEAKPEEVQYYLALGDLHERQGKLESALADYDNVLKLNDKNANGWAGKGRCIYNEAVKLNEELADIQDMKLYNQKMEEMNKKFAESLPFFEKAHELDKSNTETMMTLKRLYYRLKMDQEYDAINKEINGED